MKRQFMFVGTDCPHCDGMKPLVAKLEYETGVALEVRDVWKNETDFRMLENYRAHVLKVDPKCDGLPFFYDSETKSYLCGEVNFKTLKEWATREIPE